MRNSNKPLCPECNRSGKVFKTRANETSWACRRCDIWFILPNENSEEIETKMKTPRIIAIIIGLFILFVISIPFIEISRNKKYLEPYPEEKRDTVSKNTPLKIRL